MTDIILFLNSLGGWLYLILILGALTTYLSSNLFVRTLPRVAASFETSMHEAAILSTDVGDQLRAFIPPVAGFLLLCAAWLLGGIGVIVVLAYSISYLLPAQDADLPTALTMLEARDEDGTTRQAHIRYQPLILVNDVSEVIVTATRSPAVNVTPVTWYALGDNLSIQPVSACREPENAGGRFYACAPPGTGTAALEWTISSDNPGERKLYLGPEPAMSVANSVTTSIALPLPFLERLVAPRPPSFNDATGRATLEIIVLQPSGLTQTWDTLLKWVGGVIVFLFGSGLLGKWLSPKKQPEQMTG